VPVASDLTVPGSSEIARPALPELDAASQDPVAITLHALRYMLLKGYETSPASYAVESTAPLNQTALSPPMQSLRASGAVR
jgi:hypothetical protein